MDMCNIFVRSLFIARGDGVLYVLGLQLITVLQANVRARRLAVDTRASKKEPQRIAGDPLAIGVRVEDLLESRRRLHLEINFIGLQARDDMTSGNNASLTRRP